MQPINQLTSRLPLAVTAVTLVVVLAACSLPLEAGGGNGGKQASEQGDAPAQTQPTQTPPTQQAPEGTVPAPSGGTAAQPGQVIASQEVNDEGATLRVDITGLTREGKLITLTWDITLLQPPADNFWRVLDKMAADKATGQDVSAVSLVDPVNAKRYLVARSGGTDAEEGDCVCSDTSSAGASPMEAGEAQSFHATFTAPPPEVTTVNVDLDELGTINDVPIS